MGLFLSLSRKKKAILADWLSQYADLACSGIISFQTFLLYYFLFFFFFFFHHGCTSLLAAAVIEVLEEEASFTGSTVYVCMYA